MSFQFTLVESARHGRWHSYLSSFGLCFAAALLVLGGLALRGTSLDIQTFHSFNDLASAWAAAAVLASWGSVLGLGAVPLIVAGAIGPRRAMVMAAVLAALVVCGMLVQLLKFSVDVPRPLTVLGPQAMHVIGVALHGRAMPSGHAAAGACAAAMLWVAGGLDHRLRSAAILLSLLALFEAGARMVVGAHWPSDVLAGAGLGIFSGWLVYGTPAPRRACARFAHWMRSRVGSCVVAAVLVVASVSLWQTRHDYTQAKWLYVALTTLGLAAAVRWLLWRDRVSEQKPDTP